MLWVDATFQSVVNDMLRDVLGKFVLAYLDNIIVFSKTEDEHLMHLEIVMWLLREHMQGCPKLSCTE